MNQARFQKRLREKARRDKAKAKREKREQRAAESAAAEPDTKESVPESEVLAELAELHQRIADDAIEFEEFEKRKNELVAKLDV